MCLSSVLRILPLATNSTFLGYLYGAVVAFTCSWAGVDTRHGFIQHNLKVIQGVFFYWSPLNLAKSQSLYEIPYSNFFSRILLLVLGLSQIKGGPVKKKTPCIIIQAGFQPPRETIWDRPNRGWFDPPDTVHRPNQGFHTITIYSL